MELIFIDNGLDWIDGSVVDCRSTVLNAILALKNSEAILTYYFCFKRAKIVLTARLNSIPTMSYYAHMCY